jgi:hypothetical protein
MRYCQNVPMWLNELWHLLLTQSRMEVLTLHLLVVCELGEQPFHSVADALAASHSTILNHLRGSLGMKFPHLPWIQHQLTDSSRRVSLETCREMPVILDAHDKSELRRFVVRISLFDEMERVVPRPLNKSSNRSGPKRSCWLLVGELMGFRLSV